MNKDSPKDFKEFNPDDVVYVNEDQRPEPGPPADSPPPDDAGRPSERDIEPPPKTPPPAFEIPVLERPEAPAEAEPSEEEEEIPPPAEPGLPEDEEAVSPSPEPPAREAEETSPPEEEEASEEPADEPEPAEPESLLEETRLAETEDVPPPPPAEPEPAEMLPPLPPEPVRIADVSPPPPPSLPPIVPSSLPAIPPPPSPTPEPPGVPPPPDKPAEPPVQPSLATTDLQGHWGSPATLSPPIPPVALPAPEAVPAEEAEDTGEGTEPDSEQIPVRRGTQHLKVFGFVTLCLIMATLVVGAFFLRPYVREILESKRSEDAKAFEDVLVNMLQVDNQQLEVEITDKQVDQVHPVLEEQGAIEDGEIVVNNVMKVDYAPDFSRPVVVSEFRFDIDLQTRRQDSETTRRENFILDIVTVFNGEGTYFMIEGLNIKNRQQDLSQTGFAGRWSDLEALLQVQSAAEDAPLSENRSFFLNYVANLLKLYSHHHYLFLLPAFDINQSREYNRVREALLKSEAYYLHTDTCERSQGGQRSCRVTIDYEELHRLYADIYEILGVELPAHYDILLTAGQKGSNLPRTVVLTFDGERNYPVLLAAPAGEGGISASRFEVGYKEFDVSKLDLPAVGDPLDLAEYHRQILEYEDRQLR